MRSSRPKPSSRVDLVYYGEVITSHEACTRITQQQERKRQTKAAKAQRNKGKQPPRRQTSKLVVTEEERDENKCQGCGGKFNAAFTTRVIRETVTRLNFIWLVADTASEKAIFVLRCGLTTMPYVKPEFQFLPGTTVVVIFQQLI